MTAGTGRGDGPLQAQLERARGDDRLVLLEGVHALKHAVRFDAEVLRIGTPDRAGLARLLDELAPDVDLPVPVEDMAAPAWDAVTGGGLPSPVIAVATRPDDTTGPLFAARSSTPIVALERPTHLGNVGAVVRVAAAAGAGGVVVVGDADPWHPRAVRGGAGLQFALPVGRRDELPDGPRPLVAVDPDGSDLPEVPLPSDAVFAFGSERGGLGPALLARADLRVRLPMRPGVSSLNLATAVAALLYGLGKGRLSP